jgi:hypothetical protein
VSLVIFDVYLLEDIDDVTNVGSKYQECISRIRNTAMTIIGK